MLISPNAHAILVSRRRRSPSQSVRYSPSYVINTTTTSLSLKSALNPYQRRSTLQRLDVVSCAYTTTSWHCPLTLLLLVFQRVELVDTGTEVGGITTEGDIERLEELVHSGQKTLGPVNVSSAHLDTLI
jgi:hypothetical protein